MPQVKRDLDSADAEALPVAASIPWSGLANPRGTTLLQTDFGFDRTAVRPAKTRATRREADWRRALYRAFLYMAEREPERAEELLEELERREAEGPEWMRQRPASVEADAPMVTLDRNERIRLVSKFRTLCRRSWQGKATGRHRGIITRTAESVFGALLYLTEKYGKVFPSLEGLAHLSMCCKQSVVTALADLERLGFVTRIRRIRRIVTPLGFTTRQITNAYRVHEPVRGLGLLAICMFHTESNCWTPSAADVHHRMDEPIPGSDPKPRLDPNNPLDRALMRLGTLIEGKRTAPVGAAV
jgi:hypothetical protein